MHYFTRFNWNEKCYLSTALFLQSIYTLQFSHEFQKFFSFQ